MSRTTMQAIWPGERHENFLELHNSYGSGPVIWEPISAEYLGTTKSYEYPNKGWMERLDELWPLYERRDVPEFVRAVLTLTFDRFFVLKEHYARMAADLRRFMARYPHSGGAYHLPEIANLFESDPPYPAIAMWCTSVTSDPFDGEYNEELNDYDPFDWTRSNSVYTVLDSQALPDGGAPQASQSRACSYPSCLELNATECECCGKERFCEDHGSRGGDRQIQDVGAVYQPAQCWRCGGFNVDEGGTSE